MKNIQVVLGRFFAVVLLAGCSEIQSLSHPPKDYTAHAYCTQQQIPCGTTNHYNPSWANAFR